MFHVKTLLLLIFITSVSAIRAQSLSGDWFGIGFIQVDGETDQYLTELNLKQKGNEVSGNLNYYFRDSLFTIKVAGSYNKERRALVFRQVPVVYFRSHNF